MVSIIITTYNSSDFILETLNSVKQQTYEKIALIVSDDCSTDGTLHLVNQWLAESKNKNRFNSVEVLTTSKNSGVSANCNRGIAAAKEEWIKFIAGDDILLPNCIEDNMAYVAANPNAKVVFSQVKIYQEQFANEYYLKDVPVDYPDNLMAPELTAEDQFHILLLSDRINYTPSYFFNKEAIQAVGGYDESNTRIEDYPMWLKLTKAGYKLHYFHKPTVGYRMHGNALNNNNWRGTVRSDFEVRHQMRKQVAHPYLPWELRAKENFMFFVSKVFFLLGLQNREGATKRLHRFITYYLNPFTYIHYLKRKTPGRYRASYFHKTFI